MDIKDVLKKVTPTPMIKYVSGEPTREKKLDSIEHHFRQIMITLGLDLSDDSLMDTPKRVAKMYVDEFFYGLQESNFPKVTVVENKFEFDEFVTEANITMNSNCEHHFIPIVGKAHISYKPGKKVIGLSKLNRIVDYYAKRPQVQERLTIQIRECLALLLETEDVAVIIDGVHTCVKTRGIKDGSSITRTSSLGGIFKDDHKARAEFVNSLPKITELQLL